MKSFAENYGPYALVTGASLGIGRDMARLLHAKGVKIVLTGRNLERLKALENELPGSIAIAADLTKEDDLQALFKQIDQIDIGLVVVNAGFGSAGYLADQNDQEARDMLKLNCEVSLRLAMWTGRRLLPQKRGGIVFLSSILAMQGTATQANYSATKAYVQNLAEALAIEWQPSGVSVLCASPGPVATGFADRAQLSPMDSDDSSVVAKEIVEAIGKKSLVVPGRKGRFLTFMLSTAPRALRVKIMAGIMRDKLKK
jgi:uncharacterized protein